MELPVIVTNWSAPAEFLNPANSYLINATEVMAPEWDPIFRGFEWAQPSQLHLQQLMRQVYANRLQAEGSFKHPSLK